MDIANKYEALAISLGFTEARLFTAEKLSPSEDMRAICSNGYCPHYDTNWLCPPGAPDILKCREIISHYSEAMLLLLHREIEEGFSDFEDEMIKHNKKLLSLEQRLIEDGKVTLVLSTGKCEGCEVCSYPEPCRNPERHRESLCAFGIDTSALCDELGVRYVFVKNELNLVGIILFR